MCLDVVLGLFREDWPGHWSSGSDTGSERPRGSSGCRRRQMVPDTIGATIETTVESQFSTTVGEGDF